MSNSFPFEFPFSHRPLVVASVYSCEDLRSALNLDSGEADVVEVRLDFLHGQLPFLEEHLPRLRHPLLLTARHPAEGGKHNLSAGQRRDLLLRYAPQAALVDLEIRSLRQMRPVIEFLQSHQTPWLASYHHFNRTPAPSFLKGKALRAFEAGAALFKAATFTASTTDLLRLIQTADLLEGRPYSLMGMGPLGAFSRLILSQAGSRLNYACLGSGGVPGQWPAGCFKQALNLCASQLGFPALKPDFPPGISPS